MNYAEQILAILRVAPKTRNAEIAKQVGCSREYPRLVRIKHGYLSTAEYNKEPYERAQFEADLTFLFDGGNLTDLKRIWRFKWWCEDHPRDNTRWNNIKNSPERRKKRSALYADDGRKRCATCHEFKPPIEYHANSGSWDNLNVRCKTCNKEQVKLYYDRRRGVYQVPTVTEKRCPSCDTVKRATEFYRHTAATSGLQTYCKVCQKNMEKRHK